MTRILFAALCALALVPFIPASLALASVPAHCVGCDFARSDLHGQHFDNVSYVGADFSGANLQGASFRHAKLVGSDFKNADLRNADLTGADLTGVALHGAKLAGATFTDVRATGVDMRGIGAGLTDAQLRGLFGNCTGCDAQDADLAGRDLSGVKLTGANLRRANAAGTRFTGANLVGIEFERADLHGADFGGAGVCWYNTEISDGSYRSEDPQCLDLRDANVRGANFRGAKICSDEHDGQRCKPVDAAMLRKLSRSPLDGAILP
ncbi:MAG: pentapeptide repeat-containing protein [Candidatus Eremiobacteraeota bacterium]|nr:pentapeptide repeat-containing protein [Candidatus Eremiobacteraeota bacterium]